MIALPPYANVNIYARRIACYTVYKREHVVVVVVVDVVAVTVAAAAATVIVARKVGRLSRMCSPFILSVSSLVQSKLVFVRLTYPLSCVLHCNRSLCVPLCSLWVFLCCFFSVCYKWMAINLRRHTSTHVIETSAAMGALVVMECDTQLMHSCNVHRATNTPHNIHLLTLHLSL